MCWLGESKRMPFCGDLNEGCLLQALVCKPWNPWWHCLGRVGGVVLLEEVGHWGCDLRA